MGRIYNWRCAMIAGSGSALYGYDSAVIASTFAQAGFQDYFKPNTTILGAIGSSYYGGVIIGLLFVSFLADRFGRKYTIQIGGVIGLVGAVLQLAAPKIAMFFVGRVVAGVSSGIMLTTVSVYQSEIAPPSQRGAMIGFQLVYLTCWGGVASWLGYACNFADNSQFAWRFPVAVQAIPAIALIVGCFFIPFSPRWLITKDRHEEAKLVLKRLHDDHPDPIYWEKEYIQIAAQLAQEQKEKAGHHWTHLLTKKANLKRVLVACASMTSVQTNGAQTIQIYQSVLYTGLGFTLRKTLLMSGIFQVVLVFGGLFNLVLVDRLGRKPLFLSGFVVLSIILGAFAACTARYQETGIPAWGTAGVSMVMVFIFFFGATNTASPYAYTAEVLPTKIRSNGMAMALFCSNATTVIFSQTAPLALAAIQWKFDLIFIACNVVFFPIVWLFFPETKGLTLEEISAVFGETVQIEIDQIADNDVEEKMEAVAHHENIGVHSERFKGEA